MSNPQLDPASQPPDTISLERAIALHGAGRLDDAETLLRKLLNGPVQQVATAHFLLGQVLTDRGDVVGAISQYDGAVGLGAASHDLFFKRAELLRRTQRLDEALGSYDQAIALQPTAKTYWNTRGVVLENLGRLDDAVDSYDYALSLDADYVLAHHNRGSALLKLDRMDDAVASFDKVLSRNSSIPESWNFRAVALATLERYDETLDCSDHALALRPDYPEAHNNRSVALRNLKRPEDALAAADAALALRPEFPEALNSKASALVKLTRYEEARDVYSLALAHKPNDAAIHLNLGMALEALGDLPGAQRAFAAAQDLKPDQPDAWFASGIAHIRAGDVKAGFKLYETRWTQKGGPRHSYDPATLWLGEEPLGDRKLLVHAEQGFGDVIQFCRFAPLAAPAHQVALQVQPPLKRLLASLDGVGAVCATGEAEPGFDVHIPIMSLPLALGLEIADLAPRMPYLAPSDVLVKQWRIKLPPSDGPRVGLAWTGNPGHDNDLNRSMSLETLKPLLAERAQFVSLQKDYRPEDRLRLAGLPQVLRFEQTLGDFADTAALIACCDLVITVDTAVAHLAGALGKPVWLMLPHFSDWRWMNDRADTPWYPSMTLFRQAAFGGWTDVIQRVADRLKSVPE